MISPIGADGPKVLFTHGAAEIFQLGDIQTRAGFRVEAVGAAGRGVGPPVVRSHPFIRAFHLHAGRTAQRSEALGRTDVRSVFQLVIDFQITLLQAFVGNAVAAGKPADQGRMVPQTDDLVAEVADGHVFGDRVVDAAVALRFLESAVVFPLPLAAEAHQGQDTQGVAEVVHGVVLAPDVFEADAVEAHVGHQTHLEGDALGSVLHEDVVGPAGGFHQNLLSVEPELTVTVLIHIAFDVPKAEGDVFLMGHCTAGDKSHVQMIQFRRPQLPGPPDTGIPDGLVYRHFFLLARFQLDGDFK